MSTHLPRRFLVSDLGFAFAVHDTQVPEDYNFVAGKDAKHLSSNPLNSRRVGLFPTYDEAVRKAEELEKAHARSA